MNPDKAVREDAAIKKSPHFSFYEEWYRPITILLVGKEGFEIFDDGLIKWAVHGVAWSVNAIGVYFRRFADCAVIINDV